MKGRTLKACEEKAVAVDFLASLQGAELFDATDPGAARLALAPDYLRVPLRGKTRIGSLLPPATFGCRFAAKSVLPR